MCMHVHRLLTSKAQHFTPAVRRSACTDFNLVAIALIVEERIVASDLVTSGNVTNGDGLVGHFGWSARKEREVRIGRARVVHEAVPTVHLSLRNGA